MMRDSIRLKPTRRWAFLFVWHVWPIKRAPFDKLQSNLDGDAQSKPQRGEARRVRTAQRSA